MRIASKIALAVLLCTFTVFANDDLRFADSCYAARAERAKGDKADAHNAKLMIDAYRKLDILVKLACLCDFLSKYPDTFI